MAIDNESEDTQGGLLEITNNYISFSGTLVPIRAVCRLRSYQFSRKPQRIAAFGALSAAAVIGAQVSAAKDIAILPLGMIVLAVVFLIAAIRSAIFRRYGLSIETNGGTRDFLVTKNKKFSDKVLSLLRATLDDLDRPASYTVNMDNRTITQGDVVHQTGTFGVGVQKG